MLSPLVGEDLDKELLAKGVRIEAAHPTDSAGLLLIVYMVVTVLLFAGVWMMFRRARDQFMGGGILSGFAKSPAKRYENGNKPITFADVAGLEGVKNDLQEVVEFLKNPAKFQRLGGRVPKGVLLMGPPGTGKTLLARAVAGEAGVPFFSISGSEFIQMFVGVGASRVRDMFKTAKEASPAILFIDEIDAVGRVRGAGLGGGHDEREQTLNQILSEMDGFSQTESVIVLAATNRPDVLDPALLRPGRFDRHITVDRPTHKGRTAIFKVHVRDVPLADDVDLDRLAARHGRPDRRRHPQPGQRSGAVGDSPGQRQSRHGRFRARPRQDPDGGQARGSADRQGEARSPPITRRGTRCLAWLMPGADRVHKVTIIPRGRALGVTQLLPEEDRLNIGENELHARLVFVLGGRAAEKLIFDQYSAGAENDLTQATKLARRMVTAWGMSERLGPVAYRTSEEHPFLGKEFHEQREFSEHTAQLIDEEVARILNAAAHRASELLAQNRDKLTQLAEALEAQEVLDEHEIGKLIGPSINRRAHPMAGPRSTSAPRPQ